MMFRFAVVAAVLLPQMALAHAGDHHLSPFQSGLGHPLGGTDHVLAMLAVGLWAAMLGGRALWALPVAFVGALLAGGVLGALGLPLVGVQPMILASIVLLGVAAALALKLSPAWAALIVAVFGLFHGHAHGAEGPEAGLALYALGFALSTAALHGAGLVLGLGLNLALSRGLAQWISRAIGAGTAVAGLALAFG